MAKQLDPQIKQIVQAYYEGAPKTALWDCHGTWVVYHRAVEQMAAKAGIRFDPPTVLESPGSERNVAILVTGHLADRAEWSIGEAAPKNNKNAYPWAMAEKRAKDRVALKLIGLHGLAYSEEEADAFKERKQQNGSEQPAQGTAPLDELPPGPLEQDGEGAPEEKARALWKRISKAQSHDELVELEVQHGDLIDALPEDIRKPLTAHFKQREAKLKKEAA